MSEKFDSQKYRDMTAEGLRSIDDHSERKEEAEKLSQYLVYIKAREEHMEDSKEFRERNERIRIAHEHVDELLHPADKEQEALLNRFSQLRQEFNSSREHRGALRLKALVSLRKLGLSDDDAEALLDELKSRDNGSGFSQTGKNLFHRLSKTESAADLIDPKVNVKDGNKIEESLKYSLEKRVFSSREEDGSIYGKLRGDWEKIRDIESLTSGLEFPDVIDKDSFQKLELDLSKYIGNLFGIRKIVGFLVLARIEKYCGLPCEADIEEAKKLLMDSQGWSGGPIYDKKTGNFDGYFGIDTASSSEGFETYQGLALLTLFGLEQDVIVDKILKMREAKS